MIKNSQYIKLRGNSKMSAEISDFISILFQKHKIKMQRERERERESIFDFKYQQR